MGTYFSELREDAPVMCLEGTRTSADFAASRFVAYIKCGGLSFHYTLLQLSLYELAQD